MRGANFVLAVWLPCSCAAEAGPDHHRVPATPGVHCLMTCLIDRTRPTQRERRCLGMPTRPRPELTARDACFEPIASVEAKKFLGVEDHFDSEGLQGNIDAPLQPPCPCPWKRRETQVGYRGSGMLAGTGGPEQLRRRRQEGAAGRPPTRPTVRTTPNLCGPRFAGLALSTMPYVLCVDTNNPSNRPKLGPFCPSIIARVMYALVGKIFLSGFGHTRALLRNKATNTTSADAQPF